ncbi:MFS multidrug transporter, putative [Talaromyces stipitatus ATCC 10500]|uniref:MFS multidrug transporter, putative n=1 Tax=Talaromyces stipitatus (strain ATCC 10500 / CBS 375.48 / QM 6759 / NRRL 1006) TaxID=441959 RepID=B8LXZ4_TALSN|nr:MFS multidrug transporter, putative [Talaromyces stipitatus ATCC 10500]EED22809.1 MFS multidrug transporter, putative [Talaromyces stipitatus ATCC 10500]
MDLEAMSFYDSQTTTPTRSSLDYSYQNGHDDEINRLETIPSVLDSNGEKHVRRPSPSRSRRSSDTRTIQQEDVEKQAGYTTGDGKESETSDDAAPEPTRDPNLVEWDGPDDPENPQNFPVARKWTITMLLSFLTIWVTFSTSVFSQATRITAAEFGVSDEVMILATSLPLFGFALGPLLWGPFSELFGRKRPLFFGFFVFIIFQIPVAVAQNVETIMLSRFFIGFFGCAPLAIIGGALADLWDPIDRGVAVATFAGGTFGGPTLGPILGGFIVQSHLGWRWTAWITMIAGGAFMIIAFIFVPETYPPVLLQRRAARLRIETKNWAYHSKLDENPPTAGDILTRYVGRPFEMLFLEPILLCITIYLALIYGILYLLFEAYPYSFQGVRGWKSAGVAALPFLGILIGVFLGCAYIVYLTKTRFARKMRKHGVVPEERLVPMFLGSVLLPIGLFWFGWTSNKHVSWVPQVLAGIPIGAGILIIFMQGLNYMIDVYLMFANSAIAANTLFRSALGGGFPLFATQMYKTLGVPWATSLLGFLTAAMVPIPVLFYLYGAKLRALSRFNPRL